VRVLQRSGSRARTALRCRRVDRYLVVGERGRGVCVPWQEQHCVPPAKALGEGLGGREFAGLDLAAEATQQVRLGTSMLRSPTR
jgi:hypothetical protein